MQRYTDALLGALGQSDKADGPLPHDVRYKIPTLVGCVKLASQPVRSWLSGSDGSEDSPPEIRPKAGLLPELEIS
jgi:hypothetical protein